MKIRQVSAAAAYLVTCLGLSGILEAKRCALLDPERWSSDSTVSSEPAKPA